MNNSHPPPQWVAIKLSNVDRSAAIKRLGSTTVGQWSQFPGRQVLYQSKLNIDFLQTEDEDLCQIVEKDRLEGAAL
ncbi:hypothetical protein TNCV_3639891 [Trichonephila clavipes]|nr:hypothetical protein TNCV_3639891 [Trichonephila clavipes]